MKRVLVRGFVALAAVGLLAAGPSSALAAGGGTGDGKAQLELVVPEDAQLGESISIGAILTDENGNPVPGATIGFSRTFSWGVWAGQGDEGGGDPAAADAEGPAAQGLALGTAVTDAEGLAVIEYEVRVSSKLEVIASFNGSEKYSPVSSVASLTVIGEAQLYTPGVGIKVPFIGVWLLMAVLGTIWGLLFFVGYQVYGIATSRPALALAAAGAGAETSGSMGRRDFMQRVAAPLGIMGFVGVTGAGIQGILFRNPNTHRNLQGNEELKSYGRTPFAPVGVQGSMKPRPPVLGREVSFTEEVLPIFLMRAGPHVTHPKNSPVPGGVKLNSYENIMAKEGLVVPGKPEESELVDVLRSNVMYMPPIRTAPLSEEQVQLVVSWIAQGARNT